MPASLPTADQALSSQQAAGNASSTARPRAVRRRSKLAREIAVALAIKIALIIAIKMIFFDHPVAKPEVERRLDAMFSAQPATPRPSQSPEPREKSNDK